MRLGHPRVCEREALPQQQQAHLRLRAHDQLARRQRVAGIRDGGLKEGLALQQRAQQRPLSAREHALLRAGQAAKLGHHVGVARLVRADGLQQPQAADRLPAVQGER